MPIAYWFAVLGLALAGAPQQPEWCRGLPRAEYKSLDRVAVADKWFEVYRIRPGVFAIYEPHQSEEVISYLIMGRKKAMGHGFDFSGADLLHDKAGNTSFLGSRF